MKTPVYWFPVRRASRGWGWGLPLVWQGWLAYALFVGALAGGLVLLAGYGQTSVVAYSCILSALFLALVWWKGEPQRLRKKG